ncbi:MAG: hexose kinase [Candidatus Nanopelagicales bacterium]
MILTVTPNIALDITYTIDKFELHSSMRVNDVADRAGGKGINVSRVLASLGYESLILGLQGGNVGAAIEADLIASQLPYELVPIVGQTRRSVGIVDRSTGDATVLNEAGPDVSGEEWERLTQTVARHLPQASTLVVSGSLPPGIGQTGVAELAQLAVAASVPVIVDTSGPSLLDAVAVGPDVVKPNAHEIASATGIHDPLEGAAALIERGAKAVVVSLGADGMCVVTADQTLRAKPTRTISGNPTGAGDAGVAALAAGLAFSNSWEDRLRQAVAVSAAAVAHPLAGSFDPDVYESMLTDVLVEDLS